MTKKCPHCYVYLTLSASECYVCKAKVGDVDSKLAGLCGGGRCIPGICRFYVVGFYLYGIAQDQN